MKKNLIFISSLLFFCLVSVSEAQISSDTISVGGMKIDLASLPKGLSLHRDLDILSATAVEGKILFRSNFVWVPRATITLKGDYLVLFPEGEGQYYQGKEMLALRSSDKGKTWSEPAVVFDSSQSHHGFVPLIPRGTKRIYAFGTQALPGLGMNHHLKTEAGNRINENRPIGFRYSDDDGHTWSAVTLIRPVNDPEFTGMSCVRMCETDASTWIIGSHCSIRGGVAITRQYVLRSEDKGKTWQVLPGKRPDGWFVRELNRMDEGTVLNLGGGKVLLMTRTMEGHIWESLSEDDGRTWSDPKPTTLSHPGAPPMVFHLGDGKTLIAFTHYFEGPPPRNFATQLRGELWCSISKDEGHTWSEPRFVFRGISPTIWHASSYIDMFADGTHINIFLGHNVKQLLYLQFDEGDIRKFLTKSELADKNSKKED